MSNAVSRSSRGEVIWITLLNNSKWNFVAFALVVLVNFFTLPIVVLRVGLAQFGISGLILAMLGPLMFIGGAIGQACVRELAPLLVEKRTHDARQMFSSALALCFFSCAAVFFLFSVFGPYLARAFMESHEPSPDHLRLACLVAATGWIAQQVLMVFQATITSIQNFRGLAFINVVSAISTSVCLLVATWISPNLLGFLSGTALGFVISLLISISLSKKYVKAVFPLMRPRMEDIKCILRFCRWLVPGQIASGFAIQADRFLLGMIATMSVVGQFNVAVRLQEVVYMGILKINEVMYPHFSASSEGSDTRQVSSLLLSSWLFNSVSAAALAPLIALSTAVITLWVNAEAAQFGAPILRILVTSAILGCGTNVLNYFAMSRGLTRLLGSIAIFHAMAVVLFSVAFILNFGPLAAGVGFLLANVLRLISSIMIAPSIIGNKRSSSEVAQSSLPPLVAGLLVGWLALPVSATSWIEVIAGYALLGLTTVLVSLALGVIFPATRSILAAIGSGLRGRYFRR